MTDKLVELDKLEVGQEVVVEARHMPAGNYANDWQHELVDSTVVEVISDKFYRFSGVNEQNAISQNYAIPADGEWHPISPQHNYARVIIL